MDPTLSANKGTATLGGTVTTLSPGLRPLPVVVVPGIMGTRLMNPVNRHLVWNPPECPGAFKADGKYLEDLKKPVVPAFEPPSLRVGHPDYFVALEVEGYYELVTSHYAAFIRSLHMMLPAAFAPFGYKPKLYAVGYDWRRSNAHSASRLNQRITSIISECGGQKPFLLAHSMGGLVARYYCRVFGGESKVRALFLFGSPTLGSPKAYALVKSGMPTSPIDDITTTVLKFAIGKWTRSSSMEFCRRLESLWEIMPHPFIMGDVFPQWLKFVPQRTGYPEYDYQVLLNKTTPTPNPALQFQDTRSWLLYVDKYTGMREYYRKLWLLNARLSSLFKFHIDTQGVLDPKATYLPGETEIFYSNLLPVVSAVDLPFKYAKFPDASADPAAPPPWWVKVRARWAKMVYGGGYPFGVGDGTCPGYSARIPDQFVESHVKPLRHKLTLDHTGILAEGAPGAVKSMVQRLKAEASFVGPPAP